MLPNNFKRIKADFHFTLSRIHYLSYRALLVQKVASKGSVLGLLFEPILLIVSCLAISAVWNQLFGRGNGEYIDFFLYVYISFALWNYISDLVSSGASCLIRNSIYGTTSDDPIVMYIVQDSLNATLSFLLRLPFLLFVLMLLTGVPSLYGLLMFIFGVTLIFLTGVGFGMFMGVYCIFYPDLKNLVGALMRVVFLLTPIIWHVERLGDYQSYIYFNPFYSYLSLCRDSLLIGNAGGYELLIAIFCTMTFLLLGFYTTMNNRTAIKRAFFKV